jgi:hypothetical protein
VSPRQLFVATVVVCVLNGIFSPTTPIVAYFAPIWMPVWVPASPSAVLYGASLIVSSATLLVSGLPAAFYERVTRRHTSDVASVAIWLGGALFLSLPALGRL